MSLRGTIRSLIDAAFSRRGGMLERGATAPEFEAVDQYGRTVSLRELRGRNVVLWFFPKADTPG